MPGVFAVSNQLCLGDWFEHLCSQQVVGYPAVNGCTTVCKFLAYSVNILGQEILDRRTLV